MHLRNSTAAEPPRCYEICHGGSAPCGGKEHPCPLQQVVSTRNTCTVTHFHVTADGKKYPVELVATPLIDESGGVIGVLEVGRDITGRVKNEAKQQHLLEDLFLRKPSQGV